MKKLFGYLILLMFLQILPSCPGCFTDPDDFRLKVTDASSNSLLGKTYQKQDIRLYQLRGKDTADMEFRFYTLWDSTVYLSSAHLSWAAAGKNKTFYLQLGQNDTYTIYADVKKRHLGTCTAYQYKKVLINGKAPERDRNNTPDMYVIQK